MHIMPIKTSEDFYVEIDGPILTFIWKCKELRIATAILEKKEQSWKTLAKRFQDFLNSYKSDTGSRIDI